MSPNFKSNFKSNFKGGFYFFFVIGGGFYEGF